MSRTTFPQFGNFINDYPHIYPQEYTNYRNGG